MTNKEQPTTFPSDSLNERFVDIFIKSTGAEAITADTFTDEDARTPKWVASYTALIDIAASQPLYLFNHPFTMQDLSEQFYSNENVRDIGFNIFVQLRYIYGDVGYLEILKTNISKAMFPNAVYGGLREENSPVPEGMKNQLGIALHEEQFYKFILENPWLVILLLIRLNIFDIVSALSDLVAKTNTPRPTR